MQAHVPLISIIIPCFVTNDRAARLLDETLETVAAQSCTDYEVVVVDDGSPFDISPVVSAHARTILLRQRNGGSASARNTGIDRSRGTHLVFLDADDHLLADALAIGVAALDAHPDVGFVVGPREEMTFEGEPVGWSVGPPPRQRDLYVPLLGFDWYIIPPSSAMFRRAAVINVGGFQDPWGADDLDFYLKVARQYPAWCFQSPAVTRYRRYSSSSSRDGERMLNSVREVYARQRPFVHGDSERESAYERGLAQLTSIFLDCLVENVEDRLAKGERAGALRSALTLSKESPERWERLVQRSDDAASLMLDLEKEGRLARSARRDSAEQIIPTTHHPHKYGDPADARLQ